MPDLHFRVLTRQAVCSMYTQPEIGIFGLPGTTTSVLPAIGHHIHTHPVHLCG